MAITTIQITDNHKIELDSNFAGKPTAKLFRKLNAGINKGSYKILAAYYFNDAARRQEWIEKTVTRLEEALNKESTRAEAKKAVMKNFNHPYKIGQIYYDSWGYEQTNINFYKVIEVKAKSILIQEIGKKFDSIVSSMSAYVIPDKSNNLGEPFLKKIQFYLDSVNRPVFYIMSIHGWINLYTPDRKVYCSWYA